MYIYEGKFIYHEKVWVICEILIKKKGKTNFLALYKEKWVNNDRICVSVASLWPHRHLLYLGVWVIALNILRYKSLWIDFPRMRDCRVSAKALHSFVHGGKLYPFRPPPFPWGDSSGDGHGNENPFRHPQIFPYQNSLKIRVKSKILVGWPITVHFEITFCFTSGVLTFVDKSSVATAVREQIRTLNFVFEVGIYENSSSIYISNF